MVRTDEQVMNESRRVLATAGVEPEYIERLEELHRPSVVAMALLRSLAEAEAHAKLPKETNEFGITEELIEALLMVAFVAQFMEEMVIERRYGPAKYTVVLPNMVGFRETVTEMENPFLAVGPRPMGGPKTVAMIVLTQIAKLQPSFFKARLTRVLVNTIAPGPHTIRMIDVIKVRAMAQARQLRQEAAVAA